MASVYGIKELAKQLGYDVPNSFSSEEQMYIIAEQLGMNDYIFSPKGNDALFSRLKEIEKYKKIDNKLSKNSLDELPDSNLEVNDNPVYNYETLDEEKAEEKTKEKEDNSEEKENVEKDNSSKDNESLNNSKNEAGIDSDKEVKNELVLKNNELPGSSNEEKKTSSDSDINSVQNKKKNLSGKKNDKYNDNSMEQMNHNLSRSNKIKSDRAKSSGGLLNKKTGDGGKKSTDVGKKATKTVANGLTKAAKAVGNFIKNTLIPFLMAHPWIILLLIASLFILFIMAFVVFYSDDEYNKNAVGYKGSQCSYDLSGVVNTGNVVLNDVQVEIVSCDATESNYEVLGVVDFEKYVLGVALAQMGEDASPEALKAQIITVRNFALTRNKTICPDNPENCFLGYNITTGKIRLRACELDQVYWDYDKDFYTDNGKYSPEVSTGTLLKNALTSDKKSEMLGIARNVKGKVLLNDDGNVMPITNSTIALNNYISLANQGLNYSNILNSSFGTNNVSSAKCSTAGNIDFGDYNLSSDGDQILHKDLSVFLAENGSSIEAFNALIQKNVYNAGYGTRAGVVAAAVTLVAELGNNYDVKVPYFWGGGHSGAISEYANDSWGSTTCNTRANGQVYRYCGLDCTGFVSWAIHNGGYNLNHARGHFYEMKQAKKVSLKGDGPVIQPGDILESSEHAVLVIGVDNGTGEYLCVEASGNEYGVLFTRRSFDSKGYWGVSLEEYYTDNGNVRS